MKKIFVLLTIFSIMSFAPAGPLINKNNTAKPVREKHIDITVTSTSGCTFHIVGDVGYTILPPRLTGFTGTVTISGPGSCPHGTYTINYTALKIQGSNYTPVSDEETSLSFDTDLICDMRTAFWNAATDATTDALNDRDVNARLIEAIKEGDCDKDEGK